VGMKLGLLTSTLPITSSWRGAQLK